MKPRLSLILCSCFLLSPHLFQTGHSATVEYDFSITWVWATPDGTTGRPVIGINGQWPLPRIEATVGDTVVVRTLNLLGNQSTSLHFHGLFMNGSSLMDGTSHVTQCAIQPGARFTYTFSVQQPGTYWYHSHTKSQYPDGLRGMLVINDPESPYLSHYDEEIVLSLSDWYHDQMPDLLRRYDRGAGMMPHDPLPNANLINDVHKPKIAVQVGKTYLVRLANIGAFVGQYFWIEGHSMRIVEVDGVYTVPKETTCVYLSPGQRYAFLLTSKQESSTNYAMIARADLSGVSMHMSRPAPLDAEGWLAYDHDAMFPQANTVENLVALDDMLLQPVGGEELLGDVDQTIQLNIDMQRREDGIVHWMFNNVNYKPPELPSLFTAVSAGEKAVDAGTYGESTQTFVLERGQVVEVIVQNNHMLNHPVHLHGHNFQITHRSGGGINDTHVAQNPLRRDTIVVNGLGALKFRFRADNPGVWIFHCHMEWHAHSGLVATFVEAPMELQKNHSSVIQLPTGSDRICVDAAGQSFEVGQPSSKEEQCASQGADQSNLTPIAAYLYTIALVISICVLAGVCAYFYPKLAWFKSDKIAYKMLPVNGIDESAVEAFRTPARIEIRVEHSDV